MFKQKQKYVKEHEVFAFTARKASWEARSVATSTSGFRLGVLGPEQCCGCLRFSGLKIHKERGKQQQPDLSE